MPKRVVEELDVPEGPLWFKVTGMLEQNWALVTESELAGSTAGPSATILFFDDNGRVFDELTYSNAAQADCALEHNGFSPLDDQPGFQAIGGRPQFPLRRTSYDRRDIYSSGKYWSQPDGLERVTQRRSITPSGLRRFLEAQEPVIDMALQELQHGRKESHWMWFVFPQISGLGNSSKAMKYGIVDLAEARAYLAHPVLGPRLMECFRLVLQHQDRSAEEIFGPIDSMKFRSCATLFERASANSGSVFSSALSVFFGGKADPKTIAAL